MKNFVIWTMIGTMLLEFLDQVTNKRYLVKTENKSNEVRKAVEDSNEARKAPQGLSYDIDEVDMLPEDLNNGTGGGNDYFGRRDYHWTHGIIRYEFSSKINRKTKKLALLAMKELGDKTCIKFVPRSNQRDYGKISTVDMDCGSDIGMKRGGGRRDVELSTSCNYDK